MTRQNWQYWHKSANVDAILNIASRETVTDATTFGGMNNEHRRSKIAWLTGDSEIMSLVWPYVESASKVMDIVCNGLAEFQYTEYHGTQNAKYDWHHDVDWNNSNGRDRKLSLTIQLSDPSDYEGGHFEFMEVEQPLSESRDKGTVLIFPSYLQHRVAPVTSGVRKSLVAWFEGPKWQ